jgi:hypothetical protein
MKQLKLLLGAVGILAWFPLVMFAFIWAICYFAKPYPLF